MFNVLCYQFCFCNVVSLKMSYVVDIFGLVEFEGVEEMEIDCKIGLVILFFEFGKYIFYVINEYVIQCCLLVEIFIFE